MVNQVHSCDVLLVGAGPIGIEMAVRLKQAGINYLHIEKGAIADTVYHYPPGTRFFSSPERIAIASVPLVTAEQNKSTKEEYLQYLRAVVLQFDLSIQTRIELIDVRQKKSGFEVTIQRTGFLKNHQIRASSIVMATGDMHRFRYIGVAGENLPHVFHELGDVHRFFGQKVLIVGGRNSAVEAAIRLYRLGCQVSISYRRQMFDQELIKYWLYPEIQSLCKTGAIRFYGSTEIKSIHEDHVELSQNTNGQKKDFAVEVDSILLLTGYELDSSLYQKLRIKIDENLKPAIDEETMQSSVPGIYIIGTATAGKQNRYTHFIENCHVHVDRVIRKLCSDFDSNAKASNTSVSPDTSYSKRMVDQPES